MHASKRAYTVWIFAVYTEELTIDAYLKFIGRDLAVEIDQLVSSHVAKDAAVNGKGEDPLPSAMPARADELPTKAKGAGITAKARFFSEASSYDDMGVPGLETIPIASQTLKQKRY